MRVRVEIEWQGQPWKRRTKVQKLCVADATFGILVALMYVVKLSFPVVEPELSNFTDPNRVNNTLALVFLLMANLVQTFHASRLCHIISQEEGRTRDPANCFEAAKTWYDFSQFSYLFITVKCIITISYIIKVAPYPWVVVLAAITLPEVLFKLYMFVVIYGFMKDLKASLKYMPKFRFTPIASPNENPNYAEDVVNNGKYEFDFDYNSNTKLLNLV